MCLELVSDESNSTSIITQRQLSAMRNTNVSGWLPANQATITYLGEFHPYISAVFSFFVRHTYGVRNDKYHMINRKNKYTFQNQNKIFRILYSKICYVLEVRRKVWEWITQAKKLQTWDFLERF
jgi:hypothetical protein